MCVYLCVLRRSVRSCSQTIPEALAKFWRAVGSKVKAFSYMVREVVKKKRIFYGQADRKGGAPWPDRSICEKFNTFFQWNMIP